MGLTSIKLPGAIDYEMNTQFHCGKKTLYVNQDKSPVFSSSIIQQLHSFIVNRHKKGSPQNGHIIHVQLQSGSTKRGHKIATKNAINRNSSFNSPHRGKDFGIQVLVYTSRVSA